MSFFGLVLHVCEDDLILLFTLVPLNHVDDLAVYACLFMSMQITFSLLFSLVISLVSDALSAVPDKASVLSRDTSFRREFHDNVRLMMVVLTRCFAVSSEGDWNL